MLKIHLWVSKCDQFGQGVGVYVGRTNNLHRPVIAWWHTWQFVATFWIHGQRLTKPQFLDKVRKGLTAAGLDQTAFTGHSFCISAVTAAAQTQ